MSRRKHLDVPVESSAQLSESQPRTDRVGSRMYRLLSLLMAGLVLILQATKRKTSDRLKVIQSDSTLETWELDVRSGMVQCSHQLLLLYGSRELRDRLSLDELLAYVHPDDREAMAAEIGGAHENRETIDRQYGVV